MILGLVCGNLEALTLLINQYLHEQINVLKTPGPDNRKIIPSIPLAVLLANINGMDSDIDNSDHCSDLC